MIEKNCQYLPFSDPQYQGHYIALDPYQGRKIIAHDRDVSVVIDKARRHGVTEPAIFFIPTRDPDSSGGLLRKLNGSLYLRAALETVDCNASPLA